MSSKRIKMPILGMTCATCVYRIEQTLTTTPGVTDVYVNRTPGYASLQYDPTQINLISLVERIDNAGYGVEHMTIELSVVETIGDSGFILEEAIRKQAGVLSVSIHAANQKVQIAYIPGITHRSDIMTAVEQVGYSVIEEPETPEHTAPNDLQPKLLIPTLAGPFLKLRKLLTSKNMR